MNSETLGLLFMGNHQHRFHFVKPNSIVISGLIHITIQFVSQISTQTPKTAHKTVTDYPIGFHKFQHFGSKIWYRSNSRSRPQTNRNIHKTLQQSVTSSRMKPLPHGVCRNSLKPEPTCRPHCIERLSFLSRRIPTVGSLVILERRYSLSLSL